MNKNNLKWQLPFLVLLIVGTVLILRKQSPYQTDQGLVFGTVYKITYQSSENLKSKVVDLILVLIGMFFLYLGNVLG
jgi:FAD:protein FMN transferase